MSAEPPIDRKERGERGGGDAASESSNHGTTGRSPGGMPAQKGRPPPRARACGQPRTPQQPGPRGPFRRRAAGAQRLGRPSRWQRRPWIDNGHRHLEKRYLTVRVNKGAWGTLGTAAFLHLTECRSAQRREGPGAAQGTSPVRSSLRPPETQINMPAHTSHPGCRITVLTTHDLD